MRRKPLPEDFSQNTRLPIRIVSPDFGHLPNDAAAAYDAPGGLPYFFFIFVLEGSCRYRIDGTTYDVGARDLLFSLPAQIQETMQKPAGAVYYKLGFDEACLARLPRQYGFLANPLSGQKQSLSEPVAKRIHSVFEILLGLLHTPDTSPDIILAHLNSLLTEIDAAYVAAERQPAREKLGTFLAFKLFVEDNLTEHPAIREISERLAVSTDSLYQIVKGFSGLSPKEFVTNRLILEAQRRMSSGRRTSVKELAYELGFNDPDYFSRLFKKVTGKTVAAFFKDLS